MLRKSDFEYHQDKLRDLKDTWLNNPHWNIEDTPGFEEDKEELLQYRYINDYTEEWRQGVLKKNHDELLALADELGFPGNVKFAKQWKELLETIGNIGGRLRNQEFHHARF